MTLGTLLLLHRLHAAKSPFFCKVWKLHKQLTPPGKGSSLPPQRFFDSFARRVASGEVWRDAWRSTNNGFEQLVYETKKTAESIDRWYSVSRWLSAVAQSAVCRAREIDRDLEITQRWRTFTLDFSRDWPRDYKEAARLRDSFKSFEEEEPILHFRRLLKEAIADERFEDAARCRDELKEIAPHCLLKCSSDATTLAQLRVVTLQEENGAYEKAISNCQNKIQEKLE